MADTTELEKIEQEATPISTESLQQEYQKALLETGIRASKLLSELIDLKMMPEPRAKETAEVALEALKLIDSTPTVSPQMESSPLDAN